MGQKKKRHKKKETKTKKIAQIWKKLRTNGQIKKMRKKQWELKKKSRAKCGSIERKNDTRKKKQKQWKSGRIQKIAHKKIQAKIALQFKEKNGTSL